MKWRQFVYGQRRDDELLNRIASMFVEDAVVAYRDLTRSL